MHLIKRSAAMTFILLTFILLALFSMPLRATTNSTSNLSNLEFSKLFDAKDPQAKELLIMTKAENAEMNECVNESLSEGKDADLDHYEATDGCINEVLGDIYN